MGSVEGCRSQQTSRQYKIYTASEIRETLLLISFYLVNDNNYLPVFFIVLIKITFKCREKNGKELSFIKPSYINFVVSKAVSDFVRLPENPSRHTRM